MVADNEGVETNEVLDLGKKSLIEFGRPFAEDVFHNEESSRLQKRKRSSDDCALVRRVVRRIIQDDIKEFAVLCGGFQFGFDVSILTCVHQPKEEARESKGRNGLKIGLIAVVSVDTSLGKEAAPRDQGGSAKDSNLAELNRFVLKRLKQKRIRHRVRMTVPLGCIRGLVCSRFGTNLTQRRTTVCAVQDNGIHLNVLEAVV